MVRLLISGFQVQVLDGAIGDRSARRAGRTFLRIFGRIVFVMAQALRLSIRLSQSEPAMSDVSQPKGAHAPTVMIVDDAELSRQTLARLLKREGYQTLCANGGNQALHLLRQSEPDLILLDVNMPGLDGLELLEMLHENPQWRA